MYNVNDDSKRECDPLTYAVSCQFRKGGCECDFPAGYISYGIMACNGNHYILEAIDDITLTPERALEICNLLTQQEVSIIHFRDVIMDLVSA